MNWIKRAASKLAKRYKTNDPYEIADYRGITVILESLGSTLGYHNTYKRVSFIHINCEITKTLQRFVCAHELGHATLHQRMNTPFLRSITLFSIDRIEREANEFAVELLVPDKVVYDYSSTLTTLHEVAAAYGIPREIISLKIKAR